jgi:hypothetical protein
MKIYQGANISKAMPDSVSVRGIALIVLLIFSLISCRGPQTGSGESHAGKGDINVLRRSDVVLSWGSFNRKAVTEYGVSVWGWGPSAMYARDYRDVPERIQEGRDLGMRLIMGMVCETIRPSPKTAGFEEFRDNPGLMNSMCRDIAGDPMVPSWWNIDYGDGHRTWWNCANNPDFREWFKDKAGRVIGSGADGLFIDGILSNRQIVEMGGCYCDHCVSLFNKYLMDHYSATELKGLGIRDISGFNYRDMVRQVAADRGSYMKALRAGEIPMLDIYRDFQMEYDKKFILDVIRAARKAGQDDVPAAGNACMFWPDWLICGDFLDFFVIELDFWSEPGHMPVLQYKIASALDRPMATWPIGPSVEQIKKNGYYGMLKQWIALTYAHGANFMIPYHLWASTHESGDMAVIDAPFKEYAPMYDFIRENAALFDGYDDLAQLAVVYSNGARRSMSTALSRTCWELLNANVPFSLALAEDRYVPAYATADLSFLEKYELVIVPEYSLERARLSESSRNMVERLMSEQKAMLWKGADNLATLIDPLVSVEKGKHLWIIPRENPDNPDVPYVIHVVNNHYDREKDTLFPQRDARIRLSSQMIGGLNLSGVRAYVPGNDPEVLEIEFNTEGDLLVNLPESDLWWLLAVETKK